ncbi:MAG TPA: hypothetical protein P5085_06975 [Paludibacteraceae bacterium]|nr:hypothetical protein [Paludibacteraceae bacterium]HRT78974.1 hypothetical protein [Paludibacteraceae bacterium]
MGKISLHFAAAQLNRVVEISKVKHLPDQIIKSSFTFLFNNFGINRLRKNLEQLRKDL